MSWRPPNSCFRRYTVLREQFKALATSWAVMIFPRFASPPTSLGMSFPRVFALHGAQRGGKKPQVLPLREVKTIFRYGVVSPLAI